MTFPLLVATYLAAVIDYEGYNAPLAAMYVATVGWAKVHGLVSLELFNQIQPLIGDAEAFYRYEVTRFIAENGVWS